MPSSCHEEGLSGQGFLLGESHVRVRYSHRMLPAGRDCRGLADATVGAIQEAQIAWGDISVSKIGADAALHAPVQLPEHPVSQRECGRGAVSTRFSEVIWMCSTAISLPLEPSAGNDLYCETQLRVR